MGRLMAKIHNNVSRILREAASLRKDAVISAPVKPATPVKATYTLADAFFNGQVGKINNTKSTQRWVTQVTNEISNRAKEHQKKIIGQITETMDQLGIGWVDSKIPGNHGADKFIIESRAKSKQSCQDKGLKFFQGEIKKICGLIDSVKNPHLQADDIFAENGKKTSLQTKKLIKKLRASLAPYETEKGVPLCKIEEVLRTAKLETKGKAGQKLLDSIRKNIQQQQLVKAKSFFENVKTNQTNIDETEKSIRDAIGIRFIIPSQTTAKINALPENERLQVVKKLIDDKIDAVWEIFGHEKNRKDNALELVRLTNYSGRTPYGEPLSYIREAKIQEYQLTHPNMRRNDESEVSGYICQQTNGVYMIDDKSVRVEFQARGEALHKVAAAEHFIYDRRQGKTLDLSAFPKENHEILCQIEQEAQKLKKNKPLNAQYNEYLANCYYYEFAKEHGIDIPYPQLPQGVSELLKMEALLKVAH